MTKNKLGRRAGTEGFTLVELLVVIVIISILAAIAIPIFFRQREKGFHAQTVSSLRDGATAMQAWATENGGGYAPEPPAGTVRGGEVGDMAFLVEQGWRRSASVTLDIVSADVVAFCLEAVHESIGTLNLRYASGEGTVEEGPCA